jgi:hypothetical protein
MNSRSHLELLGGQPRVAALLDLENLLHDARRVGPRAVCDCLAIAMDRISAVGQLAYAVGCCDYWLARVVYPAVVALGIRVHGGPVGPDRADAELLRRGRELPRSVDTVVIGSGDGCFAPLARHLRQSGQRVVVAGRGGTIAAALRTEADRVIDLDFGPLAPEPLADAA